MCQPGWEQGLGENGYMYLYGWVPFLSTWNYHNTVHQLYSNTKKTSLKFGEKKELSTKPTKKKWTNKQQQQQRITPTKSIFLFSPKNENQICPHWAYTSLWQLSAASKPCNHLWTQTRPCSLCSHRLLPNWEAHFIHLPAWLQEAFECEIPAQLDSLWFVV